MRPSGPRTNVEEYALVGDRHTAALVGRDGGIDWLCLPRFDSPACLAALLDGDRAGTWRIAPAAGGPATRRRYRRDTLVLETEWDTPDGTVRLTDCMPPRTRSARVVRVVEGVSGRVPMRMLLRLRFDYGHLTPATRHGGTRLTAVAGPDAVWLDSALPLTGIPGATRAEFAVAAGQRLGFVLSHTASHLPEPAPVDAGQAVEDTAASWSSWAARCAYRGPWEPEVRGALITLRALTHAPTGGVLASAPSPAPPTGSAPATHPTAPTTPRPDNSTSPPTNPPSTSATPTTARHPPACGARSSTPSTQPRTPAWPTPARPGTSDAGCSTTSKPPGTAPAADPGRWAGTNTACSRK